MLFGGCCFTCFNRLGVVVLLLWWCELYWFARLICFFVGCLVFCLLCLGWLVVLGVLRFVVDLVLSRLLLCGWCGLLLESVCFLLWLPSVCGIGIVWFSLVLWVMLVNSVDLSFSFCLCLYVCCLGLFLIVIVD